MSYKWCVVPQCTNTSNKTPAKMFVSIPKYTKNRKEWLELARRNPKDISARTNAFMCEDHFNMPEDMANYTKYKMGFSQKIFMVSGALPSKFDCQGDHGIRLPDTTIPQTTYISKRLKTDHKIATKTVADKPVTSTTKDDNAIVVTAAEITDRTRDSITSPGVSQHDENMLTESEAPQTSKDAPMEITKCAYSSSTESALSDTDDLSTYENSQTSAEILRREETIERFKGYTIIANVYHYLNREYELMKSQLRGRCDLSPLANIFNRTAAATGVTQRAVAHALDTHKLKTSIKSDHSYNLGNTRTHTAPSKSKKTGSSANMRRKDRTQSYKRRTNKQQADGCDAEGVRPPKQRTATSSLKSKPTNEKQLPSNLTAVYSYNTQRKDRVPSYKRRTNNNEQDEESDGEGTPPKRRTPRNSVSSKPTNEEQLPSRSPIHCRTPEAIETEFKAEPADDEYLRKPEADPLETESSPAALEEPSDASEIEMKFERVDEEYADLCTDYSICDPVLLDMKPEPLLD